MIDAKAGDILIHDCIVRRVWEYNGVLGYTCSYGDFVPLSKNKLPWIVVKPDSLKHCQIRAMFNTSDDGLTYMNTYNIQEINYSRKQYLINDDAGNLKWYDMDWFEFVCDEEADN